MPTFSSKHGALAKARPDAKGAIAGLQKGIDPRAIDKHFKFKEGHEPGYLEPESGWRYLDVEFTGEPADPHQLDLLHGGPAVNMNCARCGTQLHAVGEMSTWGIMHQESVEVVNEDDIAEERKRELQNEIVVILACPDCKAKFQWLKDFLPRD